MKLSNGILISILLLAVLLRFWDLGGRWQIFADSARDVLVARQSLKIGQFPLVGSFSSAGPFVFAPVYYWYLSLTYLISPDSLLLPWIITNLLWIGTVYLMYLSGRLIADRKLGLILALITGICPAQINRSILLTQHSLVGISAVAVFYCFILYCKKPKTSTILLLGLAAGFGLSMHYQAINLLFFGIAAVAYVIGKLNFKRILIDAVVLTAGILLPSTALFVWDSWQGWANTRNLMDYFLIAQYRIYVPNRWLTYLTEFWPDFWGAMAGGNKIFGGLLMLLSFISIGWLVIKRKINKIILFSAIIFSCQIILFRYHKGERFEGYLMFFHPLVLFFSGLAVWNIYIKHKFIACILLILLVAGTIKQDYKFIASSTSQSKILEVMVTDIKQKYPGKKFRIYDYKMNSASHSFGLSLFLDKYGLIDEKSGYKLGMCMTNCRVQLPIVTDIFKPTLVVDINGFSDDSLIKPDWYPVGPMAVYEDVALWWQKKPLTSSFSLQKYLLGI